MTKYADKRLCCDVSEKKTDKKSTIESLEYYRHQTERIALSLSLNRSILAERAEKMMLCGSYIELQNDKVVGANFCRQRICPMCQRRRSLDVAANTRDIVNYLTERDGRKFLHLVLTVPNVGLCNLDETITRMYKASSAMFRDKKLCRKFKGVMRCLEVSYNKRVGYIDGDVDGGLTIIGNAFHPHLHCLVSVGKSYGSGKNYIRQDELLDLWRSYYGDCKITQLHVSAVKDFGAVSEVAKYCVKPLDLDLTDYELSVVVEAIFGALHGRRLIQLFGDFREAARTLKIEMEAERQLQADEGFQIKRYYYNLNKGCYDLQSFSAVAAAESLLKCR